MSEAKRMRTLFIFLTVFLISGSAFAGVITGSVQFEGVAPERALVSMNADPTCASLNQEPAYTENVVVNDNGTLRNVFLYIKSGLTGTFPAPAEAVVIDQKGCQYHPHVLGLQVGQSLSIRNSDATLHNVHSMAENSKQFNLGMPIQGMKLKKKIDTEEVMVKFKCDVHPWMSAFIGVLSHPFFSVSSDTGAFEINNVPAGEYVIGAWHETYGTQEQTVTVGEGSTELHFTFSS